MSENGGVIGPVNDPVIQAEKITEVTSTGTFTTGAATTVLTEILVIGGGGGTVNCGSGGGGGGGYRTASCISVCASTGYPITV